MVIIQKFELWLLQFISFFIGCWFCIFLQSEYQLSSVLASAIVGLLASFVPESRRISSVHAQATIYTGSFVAMGTRLDNHSIWQLICVSAVGAVIYFMLDKFFRGIGGKLGAIAFVSTILTLLVQRFVK